MLFAATLMISAVNPKKQKATATAQTAATISQAQQSAKAQDDMRGVWITYMDLSMEYESDKSEAAFRKKIEAIAADCKEFGFNTLIVQVRPFCDAIYPSKLFPASHILSGEQGKSAGYDALKIICEICKKLDLKIHAWVNPYRVTANETP
ncbi:MAG: family 10 glycosylhydrolase, partial [Ruminococcus sp.]|nr:family 10 glycosylhydrolase [Ruminococcus sp.]